MSAYTITLTNGHDLVTILDGLADTTHTSLTLFGKNFAGYGLLLNENQVKMLENFSLANPPQSPLRGQLWWDSQNNQLKVYRDHWKNVSGPTAAPTAPVSDTKGDLWWDTINSQLKAYNGTNWTAVGPTFTTAQGLSGPTTVDILDTNGYPHTVVEIYAGGQLVGVISKDAAFPVNTITNLPVVKPGFNLIVGTYAGNSENALALNGFASSQFLRSDVDDTTTGKLSVKTNAGIVVGLNDDLSIDVSGSSVNFNSLTAGRDIKFTTNIGSLQVAALTINSSSGRVSVPAAPTANTDVANKLYVDSILTSSSAAYLRTDGLNTIEGNLTLSQNNVYSLGTSTTVFNSIYSSNTITNRVNAATGTFASIQLTGAIISSTPADSAVTKGYVDGNDTALAMQLANTTHDLDVRLTGGAPATLDSLGKIAAAINNDPNFYTSTTDRLTLSAPIESPVFTGTPTISAGTVIDANDSSTKIATTAFVKAADALLASSFTSSLSSYALLANPAFTGRPSSTSNPNIGDEIQYPGQLATLSYVTNKINNVVGSTVTQTFAPILSPTFTGNTTANNVTVSNDLAVNGRTTLKDLTVNGNLVVNGTTTSINVATMDVADLNITVAKNAGTASQANGAGITVGGPAAATIQYTSADDSWTFNKIVVAPYFNGIAMQANYADLAENYVADAHYEPGTVLDFGGAHEVTLSTGKNPTRVAGVVSTNPAYLMNTACKGEHVVALALQGRCPVKVIGYIQKGDILVSNGEGVAKRSLDPKPGTIIGKALESHNGDPSLIEVAIGRC